jgi:hypothetical protein
MTAGTHHPSSAPASRAAPPAQPRDAGHAPARRRVPLIVAGSLIGLVGLAPLAGGAALLWADRALADGDGFFSSRSVAFSGAGSAIVTDDLDIGDVPGGSGRWASVRIRAEGAAGRPLFVGIARRADVRRYLAGVPRSEVRHVDPAASRVEYRVVAGAGTPAAPATRPFWAATAQGRGTRTLTWHVADGDWQIVAMNPDGSRGVRLGASLGVRFSHLDAVTAGLVGVGLLLTAGGVVMLTLGARRRPVAGAGHATASA